MQSIDQQAAASQTSGQPLSRNSRIQTPNSSTLSAINHTLHEDHVRVVLTVGCCPGRVTQPRAEAVTRTSIYAAGQASSAAPLQLTSKPP
jgi:hypothetical protein